MRPQAGQLSKSEKHIIKQSSKALKLDKQYSVINSLFMVVDKISRWHESDLHDYSELKSKTLRVKITYMDKNPTTYS